MEEAEEEKSAAQPVEATRTNTVEEDDVEYLPYRTLTAGTRMEEYTNETATGEIIRTIRSNVTGRVERYEVVTFTIGDKENPKNWSKAYKWWCTMCVAVTCFVVAFNSAVVTADITGVSRTFGCSDEASLLSITLFVMGFGIGPMAFAPLSEIVGRRPIYGVTLLVAVIFIIPGAVAQNLGTLLVARFIDGIAFSAPMTLVGGTLADLWRSEERGVPMAAFSAAPFIGPAIGKLEHSSCVLRARTNLHRPTCWRFCV